MQKTYQKLKDQKYQKPIFGQEDSHARISQSQDTKKDLKENAQAYFSNLLGSLKSKKKKISPNGLP